MFSNVRISYLFGRIHASHKRVKIKKHPLSIRTNTIQLEPYFSNQFFAAEDGKNKLKVKINVSPVFELFSNNI